MKKTLLVIAWSSLILGGVISLYFIFSTAIDNYWIWGNEQTDYATTGQFGDFIGGVVGTIFSLAGTLLIFLTFREQAKQNKREAFESSFFEMIRLHRQNVTETSYEKYSEGLNILIENRIVFKLIFQEFLECFREVKKFSNSNNPDDYLLKKQKAKLLSIIKENNNSIDIIELALIDISYSIVYFGVEEEGEIVLRDRFKNMYQAQYFYSLIKYIKLKPKRNNSKRWEIWEELISHPFKKFTEVNKEYYAYRKHLSRVNMSKEAQKLLFTKEFEKYYGGHQHRLGHYFRHLFQSYKFLNYHDDIKDRDKYYYAKLLRAQLSTYEQALLFVNSLSSLGMKWEFTPELTLMKKGEKREKCMLISHYNLIKNLPGNHFFGLTYKKYYPKINYENKDDQ